MRAFLRPQKKEHAMSQAIATRQQQRQPTGLEAQALREIHLSRQLAQEQAINAGLRKRIQGFYAPDCPADRMLRIYRHPELGDLECWLICEEAEPENGQPGVLELEYAWLRGVDIASRLLKGEVQAIECAAGKALDVRGLA